MNSLKYIAIGLSTTLLTACGGGDGNATSPRDNAANLADFNNVFKTANVMIFATDAGKDLVAGLIESSEYQGVNNTNTQTCSNNGSLNTNESGSLLTLSANNCINQIDLGNSTFDVRLHNSFTLDCGAVDAQNNCEYGALQLNNFELSTTETDTNSNTNGFSGQMTGNTTKNSTGNVLLNATATLSTTENTATRSANLKFDQTHYTGNTTAFTINGTIGVDVANCVNGTATVSTTGTLAINDDERINSGTFTLQNAEGAIANIAFNTDGSSTVTINGQSQNFTAADQDSVCQ